MTMPQQFTAQLRDKRQLTDRFVQYYFELVAPNALEFAAGQYMSVQVTAAGDRRSYSIVSAPTITHGFELLIDHEPAGLGAQYFQSLQIGDEIKALGPLGLFQLDPVEPSYAFVATGSGVAPFRSMILQLLQQQQTDKPITLYWGLRSATDLFWHAEFQELVQSFPNFRFHPTLSQGPQEWPLCRGRVTDCLSVHEIDERAGYYLCGATPMIADVKSILLSRAIQESAIHHEKFF